MRFLSGSGKPDVPDEREVREAKESQKRTALKLRAALERIIDVIPDDPVLVKAHRDAERVIREAGR